MDPRLRVAIASFIEGDYERAEAAFERLVGALESEDESLTALLYLGRTRLALGDHEGAADAFTAGRVRGGGAPFDAYLQEAGRFLLASPSTIRLAEVVTREQVATLLVHALAVPAAVGRRGDRDASQPGASRPARHVPSPQASAVLDREIMALLPDGGFHPHAPVTRAAFYVILQRAIDRLDGDRQVLASRYPRGFGQALAEMEAGDAYVSGEEAYRVIETLVATRP